MTGPRELETHVAEAWCFVSWVLLMVAGAAGAMLITGLAAASAAAAMLTVERLTLESGARRQSARAAGQAERARRMVEHYTGAESDPDDGAKARLG